MGELRDAIETLTDMKASFAEVGIYSTKRSISASAMEGTANFPVLVEDSISIDDALMISRSLEKKYASFLLTVLSMDPYLEIKKGQEPSASAYMKQFHQNMRVKNPEKGFHLNVIDFISESYEMTGMEYSVLESEAFRMAHTIYEGVCRSVPQDKNIQLNYAVEEMLTPDTLNGRFRTSMPMMESKRKARNQGGNNNTYRTDNVDLTTGGGDVSIKSTRNVTTNSTSRTVNNNNQDYSKVVNNKQNNSKNITNNTTNNTTIKATLQTNGEVNKPVIDKSHYNLGSQWSPLTDNDCKKANDLVPTILHVRVFPIDKYTREEYTPIDFLMGVKATLHPIPLSELARMVVSGMRNENVVFNFIRWTTGEIKFFKDFVFAVDAAKMDAIDAGGDITGWRPALKRRRRMSKIKLRLNKNSVLPNATLVVSQQGIEYIKENYGYDLSQEMIVRRMMDIYFLLGFVSVNTVNQRATFLFDGIDTPDTYTFETLKRENNVDDKSFKNMMKMLGRSM